MIWAPQSCSPHDKLHSFCYGHYIKVLLIGIHDIDALDLQQKLFFSTICLIIKFIYEMRQTWILIIILILFINGQYSHVLFIGIRNIDALDLQEKLSFHHFPYNQTSFQNRDKQGCSQQSPFFLLLA